MPVLLTDEAGDASKVRTVLGHRPVLRHQRQSMRTKDTQPQKRNEQNKRSESQFSYCRYCGRKGLKAQVKVHEREAHGSHPIPAETDRTVSCGDEVGIRLSFVTEENGVIELDRDWLENLDETGLLVSFQLSTNGGKQQ